jgi:dephospho-CoA kinase
MNEEARNLWDDFDIIGIIGKTHSGKTTLANKIHHVLGHEVMSFAEYVRRDVANGWFGRDEAGSMARQKWAELERENKEELRPILQAWAHARRTLDDEKYWVDELFSDMIMRGHRKVVIDDVRYPNEMLHILERGGKIIRLYANDETLLERGASPEALQHQSENQLAHLTLDEIDYGDNCITIPATAEPDKMWPLLLPMLQEDEEE